MRRSVRPGAAFVARRRNGAREKLVICSAASRSPLTGSNRGPLLAIEGRRQGDATDGSGLQVTTPLCAAAAFRRSDVGWSALPATRASSRTPNGKSQAGQADAPAGQSKVRDAFDQERTARLGVRMRGCDSDRDDSRRFDRCTGSALRQSVSRGERRGGSDDDESRKQELRRDREARGAASRIAIEPGGAGESEALREAGLEIALAVREVGAMLINIGWENRMRRTHPRPTQAATAPERRPWCGDLSLVRVCRWQVAVLPCGALAERVPGARCASPLPVLSG